MKLCVLLALAAVACATKPSDLDIFQSAVEYAQKYPNPYKGGQNPEYGDLPDGDVIPDVDGQAQVNPLNAMCDPDKLWFDGILYYTVEEDDYTEEELGLIQEGIDDLVNSTKVDGQLCINIVPYSGDEDDYVRVHYGSGCSSSIGRVGGEQDLSLTSSCVNRHGTIMHEFLHAYGFHHEHKRADRDDYVTIVEWNIEEGKEHNFEKLVEGETVDHLGTPYDYGSVMHYDAYAFAVNDSIPTIIPHDPDAEIGQRTHLSDLDIERVQILYECLDPANSKYFKHLTPELLISCYD